MEWNSLKGAFEKEKPKPSPSIQVELELMKVEHKRLGSDCSKDAKGTMHAITDTGCQTTTSGTEILKVLNIPMSSLLKTRHSIIGITNNSLDILGTVLAKISHNGHCTKQMIYIFSKPTGLYLSERACMDLQLIDADFPSVLPAMPIKSPNQDEEEDECECLPRTLAPEPPIDLPFEAVEENIPKLKQWMIGQFASSAFNKCTHQKLPRMTGKPMDVCFKDNVVPHCVHTPIKVPVNWQKKVKKRLDQDVRLGIIEPVPQNSHVEWCGRMVVAPKPNGEPRITVDLQKLGKATLRDTHYTQTPFEIVSTTPKNSLKTCLDAWNGYHLLSLSEKAKKLMNFITPYGRYGYLRAPMGFPASGDAFTRRFDDITREFSSVARCVDDSLLSDKSIKEAFYHTFAYLKHCNDNGIIFNRDKFVFAQEICEFAGFELTKDGYRPPKRKLDAIRNFPTPMTVTDIRAWFGLVNQVAYAFNQSKAMAPFRDLLKTKNQKFYWDETLDRVFEESKAKIVELIKEGVKTFDRDRVTCVSTDFSKKGLGYTLTQKHCTCQPPYKTTCGNGHWHLVLVGSRFTTSAESRYAPIEGEALAAVYGLNQCKYFVMGSKNLILATDHKPLTKILNDRSLENIENPRLLRLKEKTLMFDFEVVHIPGVENQAPDAFSRYPVETAPCDENGSEDKKMQNTSKAFAIEQGSQLPSSITFEMVNEEATVDNECCRLKELVEMGFPENRDHLSSEMRYYWPMRDELYTIENVCFKGKKMLIPVALRSRILEGLHAGHQGVSSMSANARERLFWPRLDADINQTRLQCRECTVNAPSQPAEPQIITPDAELPFEQVCTDFFKIGSFNYLVYADRFSAWVEVAKMKDLKYQTMIKSMLRWFSTFGVPDEISSDGGPPYNSLEYANFLKVWDIKMRKSSAYYPQSNGRAEVAVKTAKRILLGNIDSTGEVDTEAVTRALLAHRNTPTQKDRMSPSELLFGHKIKDHLPNRFRKLRADWRKAREIREIKNAERCPPLEKEPGRLLKPLSVGDRVAVQNQTGNKPNKWHNTGRIVQVLPFRKYMVVMDGSRRITARNRRFLRKLPAATKLIPEEIIRMMPPIAPEIPSPIVQPKEAQNECRERLSEEEDVSSPRVKRKQRKKHPSIMTSTPKKTAEAVPPGEIQPMPPSMMPDMQTEGEYEASIQQPKDPTNEQICVAPLPECTSQQQQAQSRIFDGIQEQEEARKYPKRRNVRKPSRYGFTNNE